MLLRATFTYKICGLYESQQEPCRKETAEIVYRSGTSTENTLSHVGRPGVDLPKRSCRQGDRSPGVRFC